MILLRTTCTDCDTSRGTLRRTKGWQIVSLLGNTKEICMSACMQSIPDLMTIVVYFPKVHRTAGKPLSMTPQQASLW
jgi:hypothetical protein